MNKTHKTSKTSKKVAAARPHRHFGVFGVVDDGGDEFWTFEAKDTREAVSLFRKAAAAEHGAKPSNHEIFVNLVIVSDTPIKRVG